MDFEPINLADLLAKKGVGQVSQTRSIAERLEARFGLGDRAEVARKLYREVQDWVDAGDESRYEAVAKIVAQSVSARKPGVYFRATIRRIISPTRGSVQW